MRCKVRIISVKYMEAGFELKAAPVQDKSIPENEDFFSMTPSGEISLFITNPKLKGVYSPGEFYYLDISPVPVSV